MSQETADILVEMGKKHLVRQREDKIVAKGKGELTTFWVALGAEPDEDVVEGDEDESEEIPGPINLSRNVSTDSIMEGRNEDESDESEEEVVEVMEEEGNSPRKAPSSRKMPNATTPSRARACPTGRRRPPAVSMSGYAGIMSPKQKKVTKESRLVDWNVEVLSKLLKHVITRRQALGLNSPPDGEVRLDRSEGQTVLEEVREIITLPQFVATAAKKQDDPEKTELDSELKKQLHEYVTTLASFYR